MNEPRHILALAPNWLGDAVMCTPALRALARRFPEALVSVAGRGAVCQLLDGLPWLHGCVPLPARPGAVQMLRLGRELRPHGHDLVVVFPHSFRAAALAAATRSRRRLGYARGGRSFLLTDTVAPNRVDGRIAPVYMAHEYLTLVEALGCEDDGAGLELHADAQISEAIRARLAGSGPLVGIAPGAAFGPSKRWPAERYARTAALLHEQFNARCVLLTGPDEADTKAAVLDAATTPLLDPFDGAPSIAALKAAVSQLDLLIGNDSGPRHLAIAFKRPVICIMGPTAPVYTDSPWEVGEVLRIDVDCGPCQQPHCRTDHRCMTGIAPETVVRAAARFLRPEPREAAGR